MVKTVVSDPHHKNIWKQLSVSKLSTTYYSPEEWKWNLVRPIEVQHLKKKKQKLSNRVRHKSMYNINIYLLFIIIFYNINIYIFI